MTAKFLFAGTALCLALVASANAATRHKYTSRETPSQEVAETQALNRQQAANPGPASIEAAATSPDSNARPSDVRSPGEASNPMSGTQATPNGATAMPPNDLTGQPGPTPGASGNSL